MDRSGQQRDETATTGGVAEAVRKTDGRVTEEDQAVALLDAHVGDVYRRVCLLVGASPYVEDIVQETMVQALSTFGRYDRSRPLGPWLLGIALNIARRHWRRIRRTRDAGVTLALLQPSGGGRDPERDAIVRERAARLDRMMDRMSPALREAFVLREIEGLSADEVARITGTSVAAVYTRVSRARDFLRLAVEEGTGPKDGRP